LHFQKKFYICWFFGIISKKSTKSFESDWFSRRKSLNFVWFSIESQNIAKNKKFEIFTQMLIVLWGIWNIWINLIKISIFLNNRNISIESVNRCQIWEIKLILFWFKNFYFFFFDCEISCSYVLDAICWNFFIDKFDQFKKIIQNWMNFVSFCVNDWFVQNKIFF
jgi:hypothetical protein